MKGNKLNHQTSRTHLQLTPLGARDRIEAKSEFQPGLGFIGLAVGFRKLVWFRGSRQRRLHGFHREHAVSFLLDQRGVVTGRPVVVVVDGRKLVPPRVAKLGRIQMRFGSGTASLESAPSFRLVKVMRRVSFLGEMAYVIRLQRKDWPDCGGIAWDFHDLRSSEHRINRVLAVVPVPGPQQPHRPIYRIHDSSAGLVKQ